MKKALIKAMVVAASVTMISCQKKADVTSGASAGKDSAAILADKKKAQKEEMAKLPKPYHPEDNAEQKISEAVKQAAAEHKNVMIQAGGNWCIWCLRFNQFVQDTPELKSVVDKNYVYYHLNYSQEQKNEAVFKKFGNPGEKYGYPVFIVLDSTGKLIQVQESSVLEEGKGYSAQKVKDFFTQWAPKP